MASLSKSISQFNKTKLKNLYDEGFLLPHQSQLYEMVNKVLHNTDGETFWDNTSIPSVQIPFSILNTPCDQEQYKWTFDGTTYNRTKTPENGFSPIMQCPKYLGFRILENNEQYNTDDDTDDGTRIYLYIGEMVKGEFQFKDKYHIDTTKNGTVNYLRQSHNRFIETDDGDYFYYKVAAGTGDVIFMGSDVFPQSDSDIISSTTTIVKNDGDLSTTASRYYSIILPSGCFYAIYNKKGMPNFLKYVDSNGQTITKSTFNVSYQKGLDNNNNRIIQVNRGASFGIIPNNVGPALLRLPIDYNLEDLIIYTSKYVSDDSKNYNKSLNSEQIGRKIIKDFYFQSQKGIFWNDSVHPMMVGRRFYGVPYSSRWVNSHYVGFEVTPETALNALNDPYSIAYDGGFSEVVYEGDIVVGKIRGTSVSGYSEISGKGLNDEGLVDENLLEEDKIEVPDEKGGTGYGLVCSAFTNLICGNPYPQSNQGYTFDSNFILKNIDIENKTVGTVLVNNKLSHCVFLDEIYKDGYSLYQAVDPCVGKTTHTCDPNKVKISYVSSSVRTNFLDSYVFSVRNQDTSGYNKLTDDKLKPLLNFENITINPGKVRPWRGNKAVYGSWDITPKASGRDFGGSGIGVTLHDGITSFTLKTPSGKPEIIDNVKYPQCFKNESYADISRFVTEDGTYEISDGNVSEFFRFYNHDTVQLTFDAEGKAIFKTLDGNVADDVEYIYVKVKGYGGVFGEDTSRDQTKTGTMVIAKGNYYPDLALDTSRILDVRAAIVSDITTDNTLAESWGKYSVATSPEVVSQYESL